MSAFNVTITAGTLPNRETAQSVLDGAKDAISDHPFSAEVVAVGDVVEDGADPAIIADCPFDYRLYRTPYLVLPKLALQAMPIEWRNRFDAMLNEMERAGIETPEYHVFRADPPHGMKGCKQVNKSKWEEAPFYRLTGGWKGDPWADYRHGNAFALSRESKP